MNKLAVFELSVNDVKLTIYKYTQNGFFTIEQQIIEPVKLTQDINETKSLAVSLSGSGPTVFAIYKDLVTAQKAKELLKIKGYNPIIATPTKNGIIE